MVSGQFLGSLAARAAVFTTSLRGENSLEARADKIVYESDTFLAIRALQTWYNSNGLWDGAGWWNCGNCLTMLADYAIDNAADASELGIASIIENTFVQAQRSVRRSVVVKTITPSGLINSSYLEPEEGVSQRDLEERGYKKFLNDYFDDNAWWALGFIRSYDYTGNSDYLHMAQSIFEDMKNTGYSTTPCGGGMWWNRSKQDKNAITNSLYLSLAASLANRAPNDNSANNKAYYLNTAKAQWDWFRNSGMINSQNLVNDGLKINSDGTCVNDGKTTWTYNQGVLIGGLAELSKATGDTSLLTTAMAIANAAINTLVTSGGILHESCDDSACGGDGQQFKGIFMRNLYYLYKATPQANFKAFIQKNADSIWANDRDFATNKLGLKWDGPVNQEGAPNVAKHCSAMDALVGALAVS